MCPDGVSVERRRMEPDTDSEVTSAIDVLRELLSSAAIVIAIALVIFAISGVWPPMVAIESGSMEPHIEQGDLVIIVEPTRFAPAEAENGIVTREQGATIDYQSFDEHGDVIIFEADGNGADVPIIHRAEFWVEEGENWYAKADQRYIAADNCRQLTHCPAPNAGYVTKGDANPTYDQAHGRTAPVKVDWVRGKAKLRIPWLGEIRLLFSTSNAGGEAVRDGVSLVFSIVTPPSVGYSPGPISASTPVGAAS